MMPNPDMQLGERRKTSRGPRWAGGLVLVALAGVVLLSGLRSGGQPEVSIVPALPALGPETQVQVSVREERRGPRSVLLELVQGDASVVLAEETGEPRGALSLWTPVAPPVELEAGAGRRILPELQEGTATLRVVVERASTWLRHPAPWVEELEIPVRLTSPPVVVLSRAHAVRQGGAGVVVYRVGEGTVKDGVEAAGRWFPGFPHPQQAGTRFALFAAPFDLADPAALRLVAEDQLGNRMELPFLDGFEPHPFEEGQIRLSDEFIARVVPPILAATPSLPPGESLLASYLEINRDLRRQNGERLKALAASSVPRFLWHRSFLQMPNAKVMSPFAVRRSYLLAGKKVDEQFHLGFDLASVRRDEVPAANDGVVLLAEYLGIYGNAVVVDHGYGLMSLYGHLSSIAVEAGESVSRGQTLGRTGATGLAGGDHLHFAILLQGLPVNPLEWWDRRWVESRIARKLEGAFAFEG